MNKSDSIFDCNRMITPEHELRIIRDEQKQSLHSKPMLTAQERELIKQLLLYSKRYREQITVTVYQPDQKLKIRGVVVAIDRQRRLFKLQMEYDYEWIRVDEVIQIAS